ncbi:CGCGG family rSAM-modified RiPP protein [Texcoconibacillus texcoconensis]|uniref:Putative CGCGG family rSAM target protein n=1 Tax=Texcoconibacillus texcoconensis TaxID=1095777 RepID=A0A840QPK8_9BACI|nr:putative CGCGG family rSAM target protein [Texcoconibacillus texcoconensis]
MKNKNWSIDLEHEPHDQDKALVIEDGLKAVEETAPGCYVNLVTPSAFGNPESYLGERVKDRFREAVSVSYIDQCGCGGHVLRVTIKY